MNKLLAISLVACLNWVLAVVVALEEGPIALTISLAVLGGFTQLIVLGMIAVEARPLPPPTPGDV